MSFNGALAPRPEEFCVPARPHTPLRHRKANRRVACLFRICLLTGMASLLAGAATPAGPVSDDFSGSTLNRSIWTLIAPAGGSANVANGSLTLSVPGGSNHDPLVGGDHAVRVIQTIPNANFSVAAKFNTAVKAGYQSEGILVSQDGSNYLRIEAMSDGYGSSLFVSSVANRSQTVQLQLGYLQLGPPFWLQVARAGNTYSVSYSTDGKTYSSAVSFANPLKAVHVGVYASNYNGNPANAQALQAQVDYFYNTANSQGPNPPPPPPTPTPNPPPDPTPTPGATNVTYATPDFVYPPDSNLFNVKNYGAKGDGVTDDTAAIQRAVQDAIAHRNTVYLPAGTYLVSDTIWWYSVPSNQAVITANVSNGCITGFNVLAGGSGYQRSAFGGNGGLIITGGGGTPYALTSTLLNASGSVTGVNMNGQTCVGHGFTSAPTVKAVNWSAFVRLEGQNKSKTIIKLKDNAPGFTSAACNIGNQDAPNQPLCKAVFWTASSEAPNANGAGQNAYLNDIWNMTLDLGSGNAGAVGIEWQESNRAEIKNVDITSNDGKYRAGVNLGMVELSGAGTGPGLIKNMGFYGGDYGIYNETLNDQTGNTHEYLHFQNQHVAGLLNGSMNTWVREVSSVNAVPAFINNNGGSLTVIDANLTGGSNQVSAIQNEATSSGGVAFFRNVTTSGYASAMSVGDSESPAGGANISEYAYPAPVSGGFGGTPMTSLNLPVPKTPEYVSTDLSEWANVQSYGPACSSNGSQDATGCIQAAMNSGFPVIYFPFGSYFISSTVTIPASVRVIQGMNSYLLFAPYPGSWPNDDGAHRANYDAFRMVGSSQYPLEFRNINWDIQNTPPNSLRNSSSRDAVMADMFNVFAYVNDSTSNGTVYMEDVAIVGSSVFTNCTAYLHQYDSERGGLHATANGATIWLFGFKTEDSTGTLWNIVNSTYELMGSYSSANQGNRGQPGWNVTNSNFSLEGATTYDGWTPMVLENRNGVTHGTASNNSWHGGNGFGLYSGRTK